ncbi:sigma-54 interaction domain protein [Candidatus Vecturithrix granuli]|uniref:Sigma-54 interaction domain protein n=1 Tax=Vecturithrix granuli TaxID=1499967 RepID=A0A081BWV8_VECG1|nr:sigma-54 interaction domain protein [Candidatus Vecturithrix granuli]
MLSRRKKTRPWLKTQHQELHLLTQITQIFDESTSLSMAFQQFGEFFSLHVNMIGSAIYFYDQKLDCFSLLFSYGKGEIFGKHTQLSSHDLELCSIRPQEFGSITLTTLQTENTFPHAFLQTCAEQTIVSLAHIPLVAHGGKYGMFLMASKDLHHIAKEDIEFFTILTRHIRLATEKSLLTEQFESEVASKVSQLQESEEKYRVLFEDASDAITLIDFATQQIIEANRQAEFLVGYSKDEMLRLTVSDFWLREDEKRLSRALLRLVKKQRSIKLGERQILRKDSRLLWVEINASAVEYQGKHVALAIIRDISERKQVELEKEVIQAVNKALISSHDGQDVYTTVSQTLLNFFAFERMDIFLPGSKAQTVRVFVSICQDRGQSVKQTDREFLQEGTPIERVFRRGIPEIISYREYKSNLSLAEMLGKTLQTSLFFPLEYKNNIMGVLHFGSVRQGSFSPQHFDFLQRIASQIAIAIENMVLFHKMNEERAIYKHLIENVNEIVFQADPGGKILFVNHRVRDILGYTPEELNGVDFFTCVIPEDLEEARAAFRLTLRHEQPLSGEYRVFHKNRSILTISIYTRPIFEEGRVVGMQGIIQNITPPPSRFPAPREGLHELIGRSQKMQEIYELIMSVAKTDSTVLIHGESGTGKELIAQAIHVYSHRKNKPFIVVNCAAYSENLLESELFGHERGSFTGAHRRKLGRFELAKGGTIFLDEIGEIPLHSQILLLRILQNRTFERVGGEKTLEAEVRIVAATNKNLEEEMKIGRFREDLFYRLNVISIEVPPLRQRKEDIPHLVEHFLKIYSLNTGKQVVKCSQNAMELLMNYDWFGNVRELENVIERAVVMAAGPVINPADLPTKLHQERTVFRSIEETFVASASLYDQEKQLILQTLETTNWNKYRAAKLLGITRSTLYSKIEKYQLSQKDETAV